ncbi:MAG TPA: hypothetical protein VNQ76_14150 [Planctomicrobium sp.]|nr:hypothetical protein [Planctomicrobium sp.]
MILTVENTSAIGQPVQILDANGQEVKKCLECHTESGWVRRFALHEDGRIRTENRAPVVIGEYVPTPLQVIPLFDKPHKTLSGETAELFP